MKIAEEFPNNTAIILKFAFKQIYLCHKRWGIKKLTKSLASNLLAKSVEISNKNPDIFFISMMLTMSGEIFVEAQ